MLLRILNLLLTTIVIHAEPLKLPATSIGHPAAGKRVAATPSEYQRTKVHHMLYLPSDWEAGKSYPLIVEFTGCLLYTSDAADE